jgi:hypothetical protein
VSNPYERPARPWDLFDKDLGRVDQDVADKRMSICNECEFIYPISKTCKKCSCIMTLKTKLPNAECPIGKWGIAPKSTLENTQE